MPFSLVAAGVECGAQDAHDCLLVEVVLSHPDCPAEAENTERQQQAASPSVQVGLKTCAGEGVERLDVSLAQDCGIQKQILQNGSGASPGKGATVTAHYIGRLTNGNKFDSSRDSGRQPFSFSLGQGQVIKCWDQAIATMTKGERAILTCASTYA